MKRTEICKRKYNKETYTFFLNSPSYEGETGILGQPLKPYAFCETPANAFGYTDTVLLDNNTCKAYTLHRYLTPWILKKIERELVEIEASA